MKRLLAAVMALIPMLAAAQNCVPTASDYENFYKTKTLVVLDDNMFSDFNMAVKADMENNWKVTEVGYISRKEFEEKRNDPSYSFLLTTTVTYPEDKLKDKYVYLSLLMGKPRTNLKNMPDLISVPLAYLSATDQAWVYKLPAFIRFMLRHVETMRANPSLISETPLLMYNKNSQSLSEKTLYLVKTDLEQSVRTEGAIRKAYPNNFRLVNESEVREALENKEEGVVILHKVGPEKNRKTRCYKMLMGADDSQVYFFDYHMISPKAPDALLEKDLKKIGKK
ncbi:MAG: hypothetical protein MR215_07675 [Bacteroidales bacterium]|nr:hypothetical protein [Bacteroidales bacterium]MDD7724486.1 hypothetical protein [Bacteroidales bacterium]MDY4175213.1 hypothetical protein [Bacteroidales bacterium]